MTLLLRTLFLLITLFCATAMAADIEKTETSDKPTQQEASEGEKKAFETMHKLMRKPTEAEKQSMQLYGQWTQQLIEFLLNHEQPYVQAIALNRTNSILKSQSVQNKQASLDTFYQSHGQHINKLVKYEILNFETLKILEALCFQKELDGYCDRQTLLDKQMQQYPYELSVYLRPLQLAVEADNKDLTAKLMKVMSGTQQMTHVDYLLPEFITLIKDYTKDNPIPDGALLREKNDHLTTQDLTDTQKDLLDKNLSDSMPYTLLVGMQLALPIPAVKLLKDICQAEPTYSADCLYIAKTMINKSNSIISKAMGYIINLAVYELNNQQDMLAASQANHDRFKKYYECLGQALSDNRRFEDMFDLKYSELWLTAQDELTRLTQVADYLYDKRQSEGAENLVNPETCNTQ